MAIDVTGQVVQAPNGATALVTNTGVIRADGGTVQLTAQAADGVVQTLVDCRRQAPRQHGRRPHRQHRAERRRRLDHGRRAAHRHRDTRPAPPAATSRSTPAAASRLPQPRGSTPRAGRRRGRRHRHHAGARQAAAAASRRSRPRRMSPWRQGRRSRRTPPPRAMADGSPCCPAATRR